MATVKREGIAQEENRGHYHLKLKITYMIISKQTLSSLLENGATE